MTVREYYEAVHGDYAKVRCIMPTDRMVEKYMLKFPTDPNMQRLRDALAAQDVKAARDALHQIEGLGGNMAYVGLVEAAKRLHEPLRQGMEYDQALVEDVEAAYALILSTLERYKDEKK